MTMLRQSLSGMKFIAFLVVVAAALWSVDDDVQFALLVGGSFAVLCGANVANTRKAIDAGMADDALRPGAGATRAK